MSLDTLEQFLEKLKQTPRDWRIWPGECLRNGSGSCPLMAVYEITHIKDANLLLADRAAVILAADDAGPRRHPCYQSGLRERLIDACGLTETPT